METYQELKKEIPAVQEGVLLKNYTTYKIGGPAKYFLVAKTEEDLIFALKSAKKLKLPVFILGGGSNVLISDKGFNGLAIKINICQENFQGAEVLAGAGVSLTKLSYLLAEKGLSGLEWAAGMPGTVGGAIYGSAQAFGSKMSEIIKSVQAVDLRTLQVRDFTNEQCEFFSKNSLFKKNKNLIIISAILQFEHKNPEEIKNRIKENIQYRKAKHPMEFPSVGSVFINPEVIIKNKKLLERFPELIIFNRNRVIPAGYLIAKAGLAGKRHGNAQISEKHSNFIINLGGASSGDILSLIKSAQSGVKKSFGLKLEPEVQMVGF